MSISQAGVGHITSLPSAEDLLHSCAYFDMSCYFLEVISIPLAELAIAGNLAYNCFGHQLFTFLMVYDFLGCQTIGCDKRVGFICTQNENISKQDRKSVV